jgi:hypothetical protein
LSAVADLVIALVELLEAEGRALRRALLGAGIGLGLVCAATVVGLSGLGLCLWSAYLYLGTLLNPPLAALATGALTLCLCGGLLWLALRLNR